MGEIGAMVARLEQEGLDLDRLIDDELEAAGFLALSSRSTASLSNRADAISGNQNELKTLLKSIEEQLQKIQREENLPVSVLDTSSSVGQDDGVKHIIIIDDEEEEPTKTDFSCQTNIETSSPPVAKKTCASENICTKNTKNESPSCLNSPLNATNTIQDKHGLLNTQSKPPKVLKVTVPVAILPKPTPSAIHESISKSLMSEEGIIAYRTLKSPTESGRATVTSMVTLKSSQPTIPPQHLRSAATPSMPSASAKTTVPDTRSSNKHRESLADAPGATKETKRSQSPPKFEEGTRIIGKRVDDLWYPGEIIKVVTDRYNQVKFRVKFDQGNRGLLRTNHIALESSPPVDVLNVGSRVVALRPRETADEAASWREAKEGPYGKLDVLYAGIVAEICCPENSNRFLIFFDDGFAQYLPLFKLHHVYHTGDKVWNEVAEHSQEFIQEYLEEFPNRPMVVLKTNQWVKTEWRGKWLKAKVMQVDCSLVKMLFQVDNRSEWIYRGSTRLEPLYRALIDGKISKSKKMKKQRKVSQSPDEPYVDMSLTSLQFGYSLYSKTDPKGTKQKESEKNRRQQPELEGFIRSSKGQDSSSKDSSGAQNTSSSKQLQITTTPQAPSNTTSTTTLSTTNTHSSGKLGIQKNPTKHTIGTNTSPVPANIMHTRKTTGTMMSTPATNKMVVPYNIQSQGMKRIASNRTVLPKDNTSWSVPDSTVKLGWSNNHLSNVNPIDDSTASIIQASTMRKRTTAGLANKPNLNHVGPAMVRKGADSTTMMMNAPVNNGAVSVMTPVKNNLKWEAPWKHRVASESNNLKQTLYKPGLTNSKHDAAALIQERLQAEKKLTHAVKPVLEIQPLIPKPAVLGPHKCGKQCGQTKQVDLTEKSKHNVLAIPLMLNWKREITQRHPRSKKEIYYRAPCNKRLRSIAEVGKYLTLTNTSNVTIDQFCFDPDISCVDTLIDMKNILLPDISHGAESVSISVVNEHDGSYPPPIDYVSDRILSEGVNVVTDPGFLACCDCTDNCQDKTKCSCAQLTISASAAVDGKEDNTVGYDYRKLMDCVPTGIYECNQNCACSSQCFNRVVQNGIQLRLQVFKTENRGWGLRTLDDIPIGTFICTYSGQVMNEDMANKEGRDFGDEYLAELDHIEVVEKIKEGYESSVTDIEDDSVILRTLDGGSSDCSNNRFMSDSDSSSDSDSVISDTSSLYEPVFGDTVTSKSKSLKKEVKNRRSSVTNDTVIFKEDGETFRVTMADEKYVVASASDTGSIVLRRISQPSEVTRQESNKPSEDNSKNQHVDPPPMPCEPTVIDITSSDEDEAISFPAQTNKLSAEDDGDDDGQNKSKASSLHEDSFNLRLDISNDSNVSGEMNQGDVQENLATVPPKAEADQVLADTKTTNQTDTDDVIIVRSASEEELRHDSCCDNSDVKMDTQSNKGCDVGSNGDSSEKDSMGTSDKDISIIDNNNHESSSVVELECEQESTPDEANTPSKDVNNMGNEKCTDKIGNLPCDTETQPETNHQVTDNDQQEKTKDENDQIKVGDLGNHGSCNHDDAKDNDMHSEHDDNDKKSHDNGLMEEAKVVNDLNMEVDEEKDDTLNPLADNSDQQQLVPASSTDDSVPPLMSADDLSKLAAQLHQPDEEPPKLTKMACGLRLTDLKDTITKLQSRGVALDGVSPETVQDNKNPSFEDLPLFPESSSCDIDSFSPSPSSTDSDSSVSDSIEKSSDASYDRNIRVRNAPNGRRARRFIVTLQKNGLKRSASPGIPGEGPIKKLTTRSLFGEEHCYVIDAKAYGNCGRYLNHSCSPNLFVQNVFIDTHDLRFPRVAFFAQHNISAGSELTWDYMYEVGSVQDKVLRCYCGSSQCRGRLL